jgi:hypothetical protein
MNTSIFVTNKPNGGDLLSKPHRGVEGHAGCRRTFEDGREAIAADLDLQAEYWAERKDWTRAAECRDAAKAERRKTASSDAEATSAA